MGFMGAHDTLYIREQITITLVKIMHNKHSGDIHTASDRAIALQWSMRLIKLNTLPFYLVDPGEFRYIVISQKGESTSENLTLI